MTRSPLNGIHRQLGARFVDFSGWEMPLQYAGTLSEHRAVRSAVGVFDVSHLGRFALRGPGAAPAARMLLCNDAATLEPGRAQYTMMLNEAGGVIDDIIVWRTGDDDYCILPNAANYESVMGAFASEVAGTAEVVPLRESTAMLAIQGPDAPEVLESLLQVRPRPFRVATGRWEDTSVMMAGTGYTGERGAELVIDGGRATSLFQALLRAGAEPCGLGARDTLRLEMGYPLWGQDLDPTTTPLEAGLGWVVDWEHEFVGKGALEQQRASGIDRTLVGFAFADRRVPRHGHPMRCGSSSGAVTSGNFSPMLEVGIGMGYLAPVPSGTAPSVDVEVRGRWLAARRVDPPFIDR